MKRLNLQKESPIGIREFKETFRAKDFAVDKILKRKPYLNPLLSELIPLLPAKKFITVDYYEQILEEGQPTCRNPIWHVDGQMNDYLLICWGDFKTKFSDFVLNLSDSRLENMKLIKDYQAEVEEFSWEAQNGDAIIYDSHSLHRGQLATFDSRRVFLRICSSDYIKPRNQIF